MHPWEWAALRRKQDELVETAHQVLELKVKDRPAAPQPRRPKKGNANRRHGKSRRRR